MPLTIAKVIGFSIVLSFFVGALRTYRAQQHNYIVNKHRENALKTFEAFVSAAGSDQEIKNAVLLEATRTVFAPQVSGFIHQESEPDTRSAQVIEIVRKLGGRGDGA